MADTELRQRKGDPVPTNVKDAITQPVKKKKAPAFEHDKPDWWIDSLRVLSFLFVASCALSHVVSGGESYFWGLKERPNYFRSEWWKTALNGPIYLTPEELAAYDGSDPDKPVYLAINHTIYDVSNGRHIYGPGGSYQYFGGCDAARAYVTGCFAEDTTPDMRGVEEMFLPIDDPETDRHWPASELVEMKKKEKEEAEEKVFKALKHWVDFFADSHKYHHVGYVKLDDDWLEKTPKRELCERAKKGRKKRKIPKGEN
ncbi:cytochrome b5-like heme/Steroid binding domain-containing protein [Sarocladium implicatum]|nr:cytochrome b5-like heme/Steroid binding domain-containing protein [Sarocladium implicatum]